MERRHVRKLLVLVYVTATAAMAGLFATACGRPMGVSEAAAKWSFEVVNEATDRVRIKVGFRGRLNPVHGDGGPHVIYPVNEDDGDPTVSRGFVLDMAERITFDMAAAFFADSSEDSDFIRYFYRLDFLDEDSGAAFRSYVYPSAQCDGRIETHCVYVHEHSDGTMERLFVESPERPFYLERDTQDGDLARLVITFVPDTRSSADDGG